MIIGKKQQPAFTLLEITATLVVIFVISSIIVMIEFTRINSALIQKKDFTLNSLKSLVGTVISNGYIDQNGVLSKQIPPVGHTADKKGFCDEAANYLHASGGINCFAPLITDFGPFDKETMNFETINGIRYFNFASRTNKTYYTIYADINGQKGKEKIGQDIIKYYITLDGQILDKQPVEPKPEEQPEKLGDLFKTEN